MANEHLAISEIHANFDVLEGEEVGFVGFVASVRIMGNTAFVVVGDESGAIRLFVKRREVSDTVFDRIKLYANSDNAKKYFDVGEVEVSGIVFRGQNGERLIHLKHLSFFRTNSEEEERRLAMKLMLTTTNLVIATRLSLKEGRTNDEWKIAFSEAKQSQENYLKFISGFEKAEVN